MHFPQKEKRRMPPSNFRFKVRATKGTCRSLFFWLSIPWLLIWSLFQKSTEALNVPCAPELTSLLSCFATTGDLRHTTSCADSAKALHTCMAQGKGKGGKSGSSVSCISTMICSLWSIPDHELLQRNKEGKPNGTMLISHTGKFAFYRSTIFWARSEDRRANGCGNDQGQWTVEDPRREKTAVYWYIVNSCTTSIYGWSHGGILRNQKSITSERSFIKSYQLSTATHLAVRFRI